MLPPAYHLRSGRNSLTKTTVLLSLRVNRTYSGIVPVDPEPCPSANTVEEYLRGTLRPANAAAFEDHYITCPKCADALEETDRFIAAMRKAGRHLRSKAAGAASE